MIDCLLIVKKVSMMTISTHIYTPRRREKSKLNRWRHLAEECLTRWTKQSPTIDDLNGCVELWWLIESMDEQIRSTCIHRSHLEMQWDGQMTSDVDEVQVEDESMCSVVDVEWCDILIAHRWQCNRWITWDANVDLISCVVWQDHW